MVKKSPSSSEFMKIESLGTLFDRNNLLTVRPTKIYCLIDNLITLPKDMCNIKIIKTIQRYCLDSSHREV